MEFMRQQINYRKKVFKKSVLRGTGLVLADLLTTPLQVIEAIVDLEIAGFKSVINENDFLENWIKVVYKNPTTKLLNKIAGL